MWGWTLARSSQLVKAGFRLCVVDRSPLFIEFGALVHDAGRLIGLKAAAVLT